MVCSNNSLIIVDICNRCSKELPTVEGFQVNLVSILAYHLQATAISYFLLRLIGLPFLFIYFSFFCIEHVSNIPFFFKNWPRRVTRNVISASDLL